MLVSWIAERARLCPQGLGGWASPTRGPLQGSNHQSVPAVLGRYRVFLRPSIGEMTGGIHRVIAAPACEPITRIVCAGIRFECPEGWVPLGEHLKFQAGCRSNPQGSEGLSRGRGIFGYRLGKKDVRVVPMMRAFNRCSARMLTVPREWNDFHGGEAYMTGG